jgi:hypothetical protein
VIFKDITESSDLAKWHHTMGAPQETYILETIGSGVGLLDYDNDGWLDIYLVNGSTYDAETDKTTPPNAALFHNNHDGRLPMSPRRPVYATMAGASVSRSRTSTMMAGQTFTFPTAEGTGCIATTTMGPSPISPRRLAWRWATGPRARPGATKTAMGGPTRSCTATVTTTLRTRRRRTRRALPIASASFAA